MRRGLLGRPLLALGVALLAAGCATPWLPEAVRTSSVPAAMMRRTQEIYLYPDQIDRRMLIGALDALESSFDPVRFEHEEDADHGVLTVGDASARVPLPENLSAERFDAVLGRALAFVEGGLGDEANADESSDVELIALRGALSKLDRYSTIFSGRGTEDFRIRFSGKLRGIGARIGRPAEGDGDLRAVRVFPDGPAANAGLLDGDAILAIDGRSSRPLSVTEAVGYIRGEAGTTVVLEIGRDDETFDLPIERGEVVVPSVETVRLGDGVGYARIETVSVTTVNEFRNKVMELGRLEGGLVLDLRGNTGGSMSAAARLADLFLDRGTIVRMVDRNGDARSRSRGFSAARPGVLFGMPVVVLVDPTTASAAEILSGAIAPLSRVTLVGQTTFGKGLIQRVVPLPESKLLKVTTGEYLLSEDRVIHEKGIDPDVTLFPVLDSRLGPLADVTEGALPYVRSPTEHRDGFPLGFDTFPVDFAKDLLLYGPDEADARARSAGAQAIQHALQPYGITWARPGDEAPLPLEGAELPRPLKITAQSGALVGGEKATIHLRVWNPNDFPIPDAWVSLAGRAAYLRNAIVALGEVPPRGYATGQIEIEPTDGIAAPALPIRVMLASGSQHLHQERVVLELAPHPPRIRIAVARIEDDQVRVTLANQGCCAAGSIRVAMQNALRSVDDLEPGASETVELPLAGDSRFVTVVLLGAGVQRQIRVPLPDEGEMGVVPPDLVLERASRFGREQLKVHAKASEGLREGWVALDGQKEVYVAWDGSRDVTLETPLVENGDDLDDDDWPPTIAVTTMVETVSGVSVIDSRELVADSPE